MTLQPLGRLRGGPAAAPLKASRPWRLLRNRQLAEAGRQQAAVAQQAAAVSRRRRPAAAACCAAPDRQQHPTPLLSAEQVEEGDDDDLGLLGSPLPPPPPVNGHRSAAKAGGFFGAFADAEVELALPRPPPAEGAPIEPDFELPAPPGGGPIYVFGCVHADSDSPHMAQFILEKRPHSVVVETAVNPWHGSATGNTLSRGNALRLHSDHRTRSWAQLGVQLDETLAAPGDPQLAELPLWRDLSSGRHRLWSEHLVYVAAFASGAEVVYGDRPKRVTYHRLLWCPSVEDLDAAYGMQSALNYHELVSTLRPFNDVANTNCVHRVMILERDATLLHALHAASLKAGPERSVVGVVGASHLAGMRHLWEGDRWRGLLGNGKALRMPDIDAVRARESRERLGVRWALFRAVLRLVCRQDVIRDVRAVVGPVPHDLRPVYSLAAEVYGSSRMLLAVLNKDQLAEVCQGWRCDFYEVLEPLRRVRPINGGPGYDEDLVIELRELQFELGEPGSSSTSSSTSSQ